MKNSTQENKALAAITAQVDPASAWFEEAAKTSDTANKVLADFARGLKSTHGAARRMALIIIKLDVHNLPTKKEIGIAVFGENYTGKKSADNPAASLISNAVDILAREHVRTYTKQPKGNQTKINESIDDSPAIEVRGAPSHNMLPFDPTDKLAIIDWLDYISDNHPDVLVQICGYVDSLAK
jgi:hypothetical protein